MLKNDVKRNMYAGILYSICSLIIGFILRRYLVKYLGVYNLGVMGVFENIANMLSLLNFGIGSSCMYYLYRAFAKKDIDQVVSVYSFFRKSFVVVALIIFVVGLLFLVNIGFFIDIENNKFFLQFVFFLFLIKTVLYYLLACPRILLQCDGKRHVGIIADTISLFIFSFLKIIMLKKTGNIIVYLVLLILETVFSAIIVFCQFKKEYRNYNFSLTKKDKQLKNDILKYSKSLALTNINYFIYNSTDNIVLSKFCGTIIVGYMSNYYMIINAVNSFVNQIIYAVEANFIKNYNIENTNKNDLYEISMFFCFCICSFCSVCLYNLTNDFIGLYFGKDFVLDKTIILYMTIILIIDLFKYPSSTLVISQKMVNKEVPFTIAMMVSNLFFSILLSIKFGAQGVLVGTIISISILWIGDEILAYSSKLIVNKTITFKKMIYISIIILEFAISSLLMRKVDNYFDLFINLVICLLIFVASLLPFIRTKEFIQISNYIFSKKNN